MWKPDIYHDWTIRKELCTYMKIIITINHTLSVFR